MSGDTKIIGRKAFAAITAVEGLVLSGASTERLQQLSRRNLSSEQRRREVCKAYTSRPPAKGK